MKFIQRARKFYDEIVSLIKAYEHEVSAKPLLLGRPPLKNKWEK